MYNHIILCYIKLFYYIIYNILHIITYCDIHKINYGHVKLPGLKHYGVVSMKPIERFSHEMH